MSSLEMNKLHSTKIDCSSAATIIATARVAARATGSPAFLAWSQDRYDRETARYVYRSLVLGF